MLGKRYDWVIESVVLPLLIFMMLFTTNSSIFNNLIKMIIYIIILAPMIIYEYKNEIKIKNSDLIMFAILFGTITICIIMSKDLIKFLNVFLQILCFYYIIKYYNPRNRRIKSYLFIVLLFGTLFCFLINKTGDNRSYLKSIGDPNYSGYYLFLWTCLAFIEKRFFIVAFIVGICLKTYSRNYFLAVLVFLILNIKIISRFITTFFQKYKITFWKLSIISLLAIIAFGYFFMKKIDVDQLAKVNNMKSYSDRFSSIADGSNYYRFYANDVFIKEIKKNYRKYLFGYDDIKYKHSIFNVPHNAFLLGVLRYGITFIIYFIIYSKIINNCIFWKSIKVYIPVFIYMTILGLGLNGIDIILLAIVLKKNMKENNI